MPGGGTKENLLEKADFQVGCLDLWFQPLPPCQIAGWGLHAGGHRVSSEGVLYGIWLSGLRLGDSGVWLSAFPGECPS